MKIMRTRKVGRIVVISLALMLVVAGCNSAKSNTSGDNAQPAATGSGAAEKETLRIGFYAPIVMDWFDSVKKGCDQFASEYGAEIEYQFGPAESGSQAIQDELMEAMAAKGIRNFLVYPENPSASNATYREFKNIGSNIVNYGGDTEQPTPASFFVGLDVYEASKARMQRTVDDLGGKGNIITAYQDAADPMVAVGRSAYNGVIDATPGCTLLQELSDLNSAEMATAKFADALSANFGKIDAIVVYGQQVSVGLANALKEYYASNPDADLIYVIGSNIMPEVLESVRAGYTTYTTADIPEGYGYIGCSLLAHLRDGWVPRDGVYKIIMPEIYVNKDNVDSFENDIRQIQADMVAKIETEYMIKAN